MYPFVHTVMTGCLNKEDEPSTAEQGEQVELTVWSHDDPLFVKATENLIADFKAKHTNVSFKYQSFPYDEFSQKLKVSFTTASGPDIVLMFGTWVTDYAKNSLVAPAVDSGKLKGTYYDAALGAYTWEDKVYGVPLEFNIENGGMLVHPEMFKAQDVAYPETWSELVEAAKKLTVRTGDNIKVKGFDFTSGDNITYSLLSFILQQGGSYWTEDGHMNLSTPEAKKGMQELVDLVNVHKVTDMRQFGGDLDISDYFYKGDSAMAYRGPWVIPVGKDIYQVDDFEYVPVPSYTNEPPYFAAESGWGLVVNQKSKHTDIGWEFLNYASEPEAAMGWNMTTFTVPSNKQVAEDPKFVEQVPMMEVPLSMLQYGRWIGLLPDRDFFFEQVNNNFYGIVNGDFTLEQGLNNLETSVNKLIDEKK